VISFVVVLVITTSFIMPKLNEASKITKKYAEAKKTMNEFENAIKELKSYPKLSYYINSESDTKLLLKKLSGKFILSEINPGEDIGGRYIEFKWQINSYDSLKNVILYLYSVKKLFPVHYKSYEMTGNTIVVEGKIYYKENV